MRRNLAALVSTILLASGCAGPDTPELVGTAAAPVGSQGPIESFFVVLDGPSAASAIPDGLDPRSAAAAEVARKRLVEIEGQHAAIEPALLAHGATVIGRLSRLANAIQILADEETARRIDELPGVLRVERVPLMKPTLTSAVSVIGGPSVWAGPPGLTGEGITIGIIDSGIDYTHADFAGPGTSAAYEANDGVVIEPGTFPTTKVVGGWDFAGDDYNPDAGQSSPDPDPDPLDCATVIGEQISGGHGTHVAGIAAGTGVAADGSTFAGPYGAVLDPAAFLVGPGVAPRASLYALKIFGCQGSTGLLAQALDRAADPNMDGSFDDRLDVVNGSLGTPYGLGSSMTGEMVTELTGLGTLIVVAAGNEGQSFFAQGSPASYPEVLSVAASVDNPLLTLRVTSPESAVAAYPIAEGAFSARLISTGALSAPIVAVAPALGCSALTNAAEIAGNIAFVERGTCPFVDKAANAVAAGAIAVVIADNEEGDLPFVMAGDPGSSPIPSVMIKMTDGEALAAALAQGPVTIGLDPADPYTGPGAELLAGFSSRGPSPLDNRLKPEIAAPGSVDSAWVGTGNLPVINQGTSMACPMMAGAAALVRQAQPDLGPAEVKAALMNGASPLLDFSGAEYGTSIVGAGRADVARSVRTDIIAAADPTRGEVGVAFGSIVAVEPVTVERTFIVTNHGVAPAILDVAVDPTHELPGVSVDAAPAQIEVAAGESGMVTLTLTLDPEALADPGPDPGTPATQGNQTPVPRHYLNEASGLVRLSRPAEDDVVLPYHGSVRAAVSRRAIAPSSCEPTPAGHPVEIALQGGGAHPVPVVTAFQLGVLDDPDPDSETDPIAAQADLLAVGVATDLATAPTFEEAQVFFGVVVNGPWTTPARGPLSVVKIQLDTDLSGGPDYEIRVEPRNPDGPYRDGLTASTYDVSTDERVGRYPVNILAPDVARTSPFNSTVLVLSVHLAEIGVDPDEPVLEWTAATERPDLLIASDKAWGTFDAAHPILNAAPHGLGGAPLFLGDQPILVDVSEEAITGGSPLDLLLLHHTNVPGEQWEVVSLVTQGPGNVSLTGSAPDTSIKASGEAEVTFVVTNSGTTTAPAVTVAGAPIGGSIVSATPTVGACSSGDALECALGDLEPGATVEVTATLAPSAGSSKVRLTATARSGLPCETTTKDNDAAFTIDVDAVPLGDPLRPAGGCACEVAGSAAPRNAGALAASLALIVLSLRRRRSSILRALR